MKAKFLYNNRVGHAMAGEILEEINLLKYMTYTPYLIVKISMCESRREIKLIGQKLLVEKSRCEVGDFEHV